MISRAHCRHAPVHPWLLIAAPCDGESPLLWQFEHIDSRWSCAIILIFTRCLQMCSCSFWEKIVYNWMCILLLLPYIDTVKTDVNTIWHDSYIIRLPCVKHIKRLALPSPPRRHHVPRNPWSVLRSKCVTQCRRNSGFPIIRKTSQSYVNMNVYV